MINPTLVHYRKTFQTNIFLASSMEGLKREIENLRVFGTDGENALIVALAH